MGGGWAALLGESLELPAAGDARLPAHGGVYLLTDADDRPILLAACEDLRRVVTARLASAPLPAADADAPVGPGVTRGPKARERRTNLREVTRRVYWRATFSPFETALRYATIARQVYPGDHRRRLGFGPAWFLRGDPREAFPRITTTTEPEDDGATYVGPYATRSDARTAVAVLEDAFDLCRKFEILQQAPRGRPCEYLDMGKCPAPCDGRVPMSAYQDAIRRAMETAGGRHDRHLAELESRMRQAAAELAFERAAAMRQTIERLRTHLASESARHAGELSEFRWLILQRGGPRSRSAKRQLIRPFFASRLGVWEGAPALLADLVRAAPGWLAQARHGEPAERQRIDERSEGIWCVCHYLFKGPAAPGLFCRADRAGDDLAAAATARFLSLPGAKTDVSTAGDEIESSDSASHGSGET